MPLGFRQQSDSQTGLPHCAGLHYCQRLYHCPHWSTVCDSPWRIHCFTEQSHILWWAHNFQPGIAASCYTDMWDRIPSICDKTPTKLHSSDTEIDTKHSFCLWCPSPWSALFPQKAIWWSFYTKHIHKITTAYLMWSDKFIEKEQALLGANGGIPRNTSLASRNLHRNDACSQNLIEMVLTSKRSVDGKLPSKKMSVSRQNL